MTSFHLFEFAMVILVGLFWLQIFLRGIARRNFKFEYISYSVITVCFLEFYFTYVIWQDGKPVLALAYYFWIIFGAYKGWKWIAGRTNWDTMETQFGVESIEKLKNDDSGYFKGKGLILVMTKLFGPRNFYYGLWIFVTGIACLTFTL